MWDQDGIYGEVNYQRFKVMSEEDNYKLNVGLFSEPSNRLLSSHLFNRVGDSFSDHKNANFSTKDRGINLMRYKTCGEKYLTAGWLKNCLTANIFGTDTNAVKTYARGMGMVWKSFRGSRYSLKQLIMAIRPKQQHYSHGRY